jgi:hypothetical protein
MKVLEPGYWSREALIGPNYVVSPDGKRFLVVSLPKKELDFLTSWSFSTGTRS